MDDLKNMAPNLSKIKKDSPFRVPDGYFDKFADRLSEKIHQEKKPERKGKIYLIGKPYLAVAASFVGFLIIAITIFKVVETKHVSTGLTKEEIIAYIKEDIYDYDEATIIENLKPENNITTTKNELKDDEIIEYLKNDDVDVSTITDEF